MPFGGLGWVVALKCKSIRPSLSSYEGWKSRISTSHNHAPWGTSTKFSIPILAAAKERSWSNQKMTMTSSN